MQVNAVTSLPYTTRRPSSLNFWRMYLCFPGSAPCLFHMYLANSRMHQSCLTACEISSWFIFERSFQTSSDRLGEQAVSESGGPAPDGSEPHTEIQQHHSEISEDHSDLGDVMDFDLSDDSVEDKFYVPSQAGVGFSKATEGLNSLPAFVTSWL